MSKRIKGISIQIGGDTTGLSKALADVNKNISRANGELSDLRRLLKIDPGNVELLAQRQAALRDAISATTEKLKRLKEAQAEVDKQFKAGEIDARQYRDFKKEVEATEKNLDNLEKELKDAGKELDNYGKETEKATDKTSIFAEVLKANLTSEAIIGGIKKITDAMAEVGRMVTGVVKESVKAFSEYEQMVGGVEALYGESADIVIQNAEKAYKTANLSANKYMEQTTFFTARLLQGLGNDTAKAAEYADKAIVAMGDNSNKIGTDITMIQNAFQGMAKGEFRMLDNLRIGYGGTATEMARLINDTKVMGDGFVATAQNVKDIPFHHMIDAIVKTQDELNITGTTAIEATETIQGSFKTAQAAWENTLVGFAVGGDQLEESLKGLFTAVSDLVKNVVAIIPTILEGLIEAGHAILDEIPGLIDQILPIIITAIPQFITAGLELFKALVQGMKDNLPAISSAVVEVITVLIDSFIEMLPVILDMGITILLELIKGIADSLPTLIPTVVDAIMTIIGTLIDNIDLLIEAGMELLIAINLGLIDAIPLLIEKVPIILAKFIKALMEQLPLLLKMGIKMIVELAVGFVKAIPDIIKALPKIWNALKKELGEWGKKMPDIGLDLIKGLWNGIKNAHQWLMNKIAGWVDQVMAGIKNFFGIKSPSTLMRDEIGKNLGAGIAVGIEDSMLMVENAMRSLSAKVTTSINPTINPMANSNPLHLNIANFNNERATDVQALIEEAEFYRLKAATARGGA